MPIENNYSPGQRAFLQKNPASDQEQLAQSLLQNMNSSTRAQAKWAIRSVLRALRETPLKNATVQEIAEAMDLIPSDRKPTVQELSGE